MKTALRFADFAQPGRREELFIGTADSPNSSRRPYGAVWALVGDAGLCMDLLGGYGIMNAFGDAELLAAALESALSGRGNLEEAFGSYERQRNEMSRANYERNWQDPRLVDWDKRRASELFETVRNDA